MGLASRCGAQQASDQQPTIESEGKGPTRAAWADERLTFGEGLELWLDVQQQGKAWTRLQNRPWITGQEVDVLYDASGWERDAWQDQETAFPRLETIAGERILLFDGTDDFLRSSIDRQYSELTLFAVVSARQNGGMFRSFLSAGKRSHNDYVTGLNIDLGPSVTSDWAMFNIEGAGFSGAMDLTEGSHPFGKFHLLEVRISRNDVRLWINGDEQLRRTRSGEPVSVDSIWLGGRYYSNDAKPARVSGFWDGAIAEILLFRGALKEADQMEVRGYLTRKHRSLFTGVRESFAAHPLETLKTTPEVQMLVPGFRVRKLPVDLTNVNNVRYRHDGKLVALGYNGNVFLLSDTDGDGLEDEAKLFWENRGRLRGPLGMYVAPKEYSRGGGVIVASKGKISFLRDRDGDDIADEEQIIATGWEEIPQNVDALGIAVGPDESIYFALGTTNYANGYLLDTKGQANFDLKSERGSILRVSPDWKTREVICRGVRFPVALDFNVDGELFATDQEGATWLSNGNPFDELLHIQSGKYYGFPPYHPKHLPQVIDEPSVFNYGPQHQSTCGLFFNRSVCGGATFGPERWRNSAFVCGESRGKIFRTDVLRGANGYVASNTTIACLNQLTVDCCVTPRGGLIVACHSGAPDWGTGPEGKGSLYAIEYIEPSLPQPVRQWCSGPDEISVAFDKELSESYLAQLSRGIRLESGLYNAAGDRFETLAPPYAVVQMQRESLRRDLPLLGIALTPDRRTLKLRSSGLTTSENVSIVMPSMSTESSSVKHEVKPEPGIDLVCDMKGIAATWTHVSGKEQRSVVLPHFEANINKAWTAGSAEHAEFFEAMNESGTVLYDCRIEVTHLLQPRVQVGASLDYTPEWEEGVIRLQAGGESRLESVRVNGTEVSIHAGVATFSLPRDTIDLQLQVVMETGDGLSNDIAISFTTKKDSSARALALDRFTPGFLPKERFERSEVQAVMELSSESEVPAGAWLRGREIYYGVGLCSRCHTLRGLPGGVLGPDLSNLAFRDDVSILRDIRQPSATLNPDHLMVLVRLLSGEVVSGVPLAKQDKQKLLLGLGDGTRREIDRDEIEEVKPATTSLMPVGLIDALREDQIKDLLVFLKRNPLEPTIVSREDQPPFRSWSDFEKLSMAPAAFKRPTLAKPMRIVLCDGPKDHGLDEHDYPEWKRRWLRLLGLVAEIQVEDASEWPTEEQMKSADLIVFFSANPQWKEEKGEQLDRYLARGGGLVFMHFAVNGQQAVEPLALRIGLSCDPRKIRFRHGPLSLEMSSKHSLTEGLPTLDLVDESYWKMTGDTSQIQVVATGKEEGIDQPLIWTVERGKGRVFVSILGHYSWTFDDPMYRVLLLRGMMWAGQQPPDSLLPLAIVGARIGKDP